MSEIAKCPVCGNNPVIYPTHDKSDPWPEATECCGAAFQTVKAWNQYATLHARHAALVEAVHKAMDRTVDCDKKQTNDQLIADVAYLKRLASGHFKTSVDCGNRAFAAEQKYDALCDAVAWERVCEELRTWLIMTKLYPRKTSARWELYDEFYCARAEVNRLIAEGAK